MALPSTYLTSTKNLQSILDAIQTAKAPERFTQRFLESLEFKTSSDRLIIGVLKSLGFLDDQGKPTERYFRFLDKSQARQVMAEGVRAAYADLFAVNTQAHRLSRADVVGKFKTLSQGQFGEAVLDKMAMTFSSLVKLSDFDAAPGRRSASIEQVEPDEQEAREEEAETRKAGSPLPKVGSLGGLHYNIQIILPESRDPAVYDALFRSLREHLV